MRQFKRGDIMTRKYAEYIVIGTALVVWAIVFGMVF